MAMALVGFTGFVGGTLLRQTQFDDLFNRSNIDEIRGRHFSFLACAGAPAAKWYANQHPDEDWANLTWLVSCLEQVEVERFLLISTVDVYPDPIGVDEETKVDPEGGDAYGRHRLLLERFVSERFPVSTVVRLPGLFGEGLKKNLIYDLLTTGTSPWTHPDSVFQYYDMENLWADLSLALGEGLPVVNFATEPVSARKIARVWGPRPMPDETEAAVVRYDVRTLFASRLGRRGDYLYSATDVLESLDRFVTRSRVETS